MPELPDIVVYIEHLERRILGATLIGARVTSPNLLRTAEPPLEAAFGRSVRRLRRMGKRIVITMGGDLHLVLHLMVAGRLRWKDPEKAPEPAEGRSRIAPWSGGKNALATFVFSTGTLVLTEASTKKRAALYVVRGEPMLQELDPGGVEPLAASLEEFATAMRRENHTLKRTLTDAHIVSGIGNAYSDEILHRARLSPLRMSRQLDDEEMARLYDAVREVLTTWTDLLRAEAGDQFPTEVTAFRKAMSVHGRYRQPCPVCGAPVQRIVYADNETNYCAKCQTEGRLLADRSLSRLLKSDWPRTLEELEERRGR